MGQRQATLEITESSLGNTFRASSNLSCTMLVQVRWSNVSIPYSDCVSPARSKLLSWVDPPAPQVILMPNGPRVFNREILGRRFAKPWEWSSKQFRRGVRRVLTWSVLGGKNSNV